MLEQRARSEPIVHHISLSDLIAALHEHYPKMGKPSRIVACHAQVVAWRSGFPPISGSLSIMGVPVEVGPDADCELHWVKKVLPK